MEVNIMKNKIFVLSLVFVLLFALSNITFAAEEVKNLHGKVIGYADKVCKDCSKYKDNLFIIEIDPEKSDMKRMETIYRTGRYLVVDKNCQLYTDAKNFIIKLKDDVELIFMDKQAFSKIYESNKEKID